MPSAIFLIVAIAAVCLLVLIAMIIRGTRARSLNREEYQTRWLKIDNSLVKTNPQSFSLAVIEGDKLLDHALVELGIPGKTMGERLKKSDSHFSDINKVWSAHKIRNRIAHEPDFHIDYATAARALSAFKQGLKDLGAI